jgi:hypothetical protein
LAIICSLKKLSAMESNNQTEKQKKEELLLQDTYNDDYWSKEYEVTKDEIKKTSTKGIFNKIVEAGIKRKAFSL